jgi:hypothetical protein
MTHHYLHCGHCACDVPAVLPLQLGQTVSMTIYEYDKDKDRDRDEDKDNDNDIDNHE